ncbi:hypothetical protein DC498_13795 [Terrimonas sp.]|uniref:hypothetical protein n=1 Tax=Terrimonas sp. TaxID=1914338 RepID=UPI000D515A6F|nr:hypothetical protein [Terrimonas sp.]PVD51779.1 hypothetical protein DC498_13795 [Terrimonas sp.]
MNLINKQSIKLLILIFSFAMSCRDQNGNFKQNEEPTYLGGSLKDAYTDTIAKNSIFKKWLVDTLKIIDFSKTELQTQSSGKIENVIVSQDSLDLSIVRGYDVTYPIGISKNPDANLEMVLSLLDQYGELPRSQSKIEFDILLYYAVSPVPELSYDMSIEVKRLLISDVSKMTSSEYSIVNGRLDHKIVVWSSVKGTKKTEYIDFIWENNTLIKKKRN